MLDKNSKKIDFSDVSPFVRFANRNSLPSYEHFVPIRVIYDYEVIYVCEGRLIIESDEGNYTLEQGDIHFMKPLIKHTHYIADGEYCVYYYVHFDLKYMENNKEFSLEEEYIKPCENRMKEVPINMEIMDRMIYELSEMELPLKMHLIEYTKCTQIFEEIVSVFRKKNFGFQLILTSDMLRIMSIVAENMRMDHKSKRYTYNSEQIEKFTRYLLSHYMEKINLDEITKQLGFSETYLRKIFKSIENKTPKEYLIDLRIEKAKEYIKEGKKSITEISLLVGCDDIHYFSRLFKIKEGVSPTEYYNIYNTKINQIN